MATSNLVDFDPSVDTFWLACMTGRWKASLKRSGAMVVFSNWPKGKLYKIEGGQFILIADKNPDTHSGQCDNCGESIKAVATRNHRYYCTRDGYQWRRDGSKIANPLELVRLCAECEQ